MSRNVLLFKALIEDDGKEDNYLQSIKQNFDFNVVPVPVLKFVFENAIFLSEQLRNPGNFDGIVLTSPRSVEAVSVGFASIGEDFADSILKIWREKKICYVVGDASYDKVKNDLFWSEEHIRGKESGNAKKLSAQVSLL